MSTAAPSTALVTIQPALTDPERLPLAGFLAGDRGLTRDAYALDLRQFTSWCRPRSVALFAVRRADIEGFARTWKPGGVPARRSPGGWLTPKLAGHGFMIQLDLAALCVMVAAHPQRLLPGLCVHG
jgi:hypothetical protein